MHGWLANESAYLICPTNHDSCNEESQLCYTTKEMRGLIAGENGAARFISDIRRKIILTSGLSG